MIHLEGKCLIVEIQPTVREQFHDSEQGSQPVACSPEVCSHTLRQHRAQELRPPHLAHTQEET